MNKQIINIKTGYSSGTHGCTGEYFKIMLLVNNEYKFSMDYKGLYGVEHRVIEKLTEAGYKLLINTAGNYGKITGNDKYTSKNEKEAIEIIEDFLQNGF